MPPCYDIYGISKRREKETINRFLEYFCNRDQIENQIGCEIFVYENEKYNILEECIEVSKLSEVIEYGILNKNKGYSYYLNSKKQDDITGVLLKFTYDSKIIFGVSLEEKTINKIGVLKDNYEKALKIEKMLIDLTSSFKTSIQFEYPPADDEEEFDEELLRWENILKK